MRLVTRQLVCSALIAAGVISAGCSREPTQITGTATFEIAPPADAVLEITLQEVSETAETATTLGVSRVGALKASPATFTLPYDAKLVADDREYAVQARIVSGDVVLASSGLQPVLTGGHGATVTLALRPAAGPLAAAPLVRGLFVAGDERPQFTPCGDERAVAVDTGGDFAALEEAYLGARRSAGEPLLARVEGSVGGDPLTLTVTKFVSIARDQNCASP
jgi:uncharacterized lipoprotein YbaY